MLGKQAKTLSDKQIKAVLGFLSTTRNAKRDRVIFLLSLHGLRAKEISSLEIQMVTDVNGNIADAISLEDRASKGHSGRIIPMSSTLREALHEYLTQSEKHRTKYVICTERSEKFSANAVVGWFKRLYKSLGFEGASSHSGRRTFLSNCARNVSRVGGSLRDVMILAGHRHLTTTQRYLDQNSDAQRDLVKMLYGAL